MGKAPSPDPAPPYDAPPPYVSVQPSSSSAVIVVDSEPELGQKPVTLMCPSCQILVSTRVEYKNTVKTYICALGCAMICCWPFVCLACCGGAFNTVHHYCPNCDTSLGTFELKCCNGKHS